MNLRTAHPSEAQTLTEIAFAAKRHWGYPERWIDQWHSLLTITPAAMAADETFVACDGEGDGERILGFAALQEEEEGSVLRLNHLWVLPAETGRGIGRALFREAQLRGRARGFASLEIESDPNAAGFYRRMGAENLRSHTTLLEGQVRELPVFACGTSQT